MIKSRAVCRGVRRSLLATLLGVALVAGAVAEVPGDREEVAVRLQEAARLFAEDDFSTAAAMYLELSAAQDPEQAAWAYELYGVCLEKQGDLAGAGAVYEQWLQSYPRSVGEGRVRQRLLAVRTASDQPRLAAARRPGRDTQVYGSASMRYRGLVREVDGQDRETPISSIAGDVDLHLRGQSDGWLWRGRVNGGYLSDHGDRGDSDGRVSNLYMGVTHRRSGTELVVGRRRSRDLGVYGYLDGASLSVPLAGSVSLLATVGLPSSSSREQGDSDRLVYALGAEFAPDKSALNLQGYIVEQEFDGLTERRALGGQLSWFNDTSRYFAVLDYDVEFGELNNFTFNGSWDVGAATNLSTTLGYQRSPFLSASNAIIGEYGVNLDEYIDTLDPGRDVYDAALDKTALSRYASVVLNRELDNGHRLIAEVYHFELSELPRYEFSPDAPDSDANTTYGLQYVWPDAVFASDSLSVGLRYTAGDTSEVLSIYTDERVYASRGLTVTLRLQASRRTLDEVDQDAVLARPGVRLDYEFNRDLFLEAEFGYEWLLQEFGSEDFEVQQGFLILGVRRRF